MTTTDPLSPGISPATHTIGREAWFALAMVALANVLSLLDRNILAILAPRIKADLHIGDAEMGLLYGTVFALFYALFSLPLGRLADGWVRHKLLSLAIAFWSLATLLGGFANSFAILAISRLGVGIGEGATNPAGNSLLFDYFPKERRGLALACVSSATALGLGGSLVLGGVAANWWDTAFPGASLRGWQFAFLVAAAPGFFVSLLLWHMAEPVRGVMDGIPSVPDPHPLRASAAVFSSLMPGINWFSLGRSGAGARQWAISLGGLALIIAGTYAMVQWTTAFSPRPPLHIGWATVNPHMLQWGVIGFGLFIVLNWAQGLYRTDRPAFAVITTSPSMLLCLVAGSLQGIINYGVLSFTPSFLIKTYHLSEVETGLKFGLLSAALGIIGPLIAGPLSDRTNRLLPGSGRILITLFAVGVSPLVALQAYRAVDVQHFYIWFTVYSITLTMWLPPFFAAIFHLVLPRMRGMISSLYIMLTTIIGLGIGPYTVGLLSDANGGDIGGAILTINWIAPVIFVMFAFVAVTIRRDESLIIARARAAGEAGLNALSTGTRPKAGTMQTSI